MKSIYQEYKEGYKILLNVLHFIKHSSNIGIIFNEYKTLLNIVNNNTFSTLNILLSVNVSGIFICY